MNFFRTLNADEIECRVAQVKSNGLSLLLYKTARTDATLLDEVFTPMGWQNDFDFKNGRLYGGIGIWDKDRNEWIWKWDCGSESNMEAEKGQASDAFKRAGFKWGIGRELYTSPFIWVPADKCTITNGKCCDKFEVATITYQDGRINTLTIVNAKTNSAVFVWGAKPKAEPRKPSQGLKPVTDITPDQAPPKCEVCGKEIEASHGFTPEFLAEERRKKYGKALCYACFKEAKIQAAEATLK